VAWTDEWATARSWLREKLDKIDCEVETDEAGNLWATAPGDSEEAVLLGDHMDSVPNGGWLDGALDTIAALEVLRTLASQRLNELLRRDLLCRARPRCDASRWSQSSCCSSICSLSLINM
jgi:allantoate deiminase